MRNILATSAIILALPVAAMAQASGGTGSDPSDGSAATIAELTQQLEEANAHIGQLQNNWNGLQVIRKHLLEENIDLHDQINHVNDVIAENEEYTSFGDVWSTFGYQGLTPASEKLYKDHSFDQGITNVTINSSVATTSYAVVQNVNVKGKYHNYNIHTDIEIRDIPGNKLALMNMVEQVKNVSYNEGYKDGFNDGYEKGFFDGKQSIITKLQN